MSAVRIRVELNRGRRGVPLGKLAEISEETMQFLARFSRDMGLADAEHRWVAERFENNSVDFDCRYTDELEEPVAVRCRQGFHAVFANDYTRTDVAVFIRPETRRQYARIARPIDPDEVVVFGLYQDGEPEPREVFELTKEAAREIEMPEAGPRVSYGEVQGVTHAFFKEVERPYLKIRELSTQQLVNCFFPRDMYHGAVELLQDPDAVVFVEGWVKEDPETGFVTEIDVVDFRPAPEFSLEAHKLGVGSMPDYTGAKSTADFLSEVRNG
jgi:hypothetical protein